MTKKKTVSGKKKNNTVKKTAAPEKAVQKSKVKDKPGKKSDVKKSGNKDKDVKKKAEKKAKSETIKAVERQKKLESTMPLGNTISQLTADIPVLGKSLDTPDRRPWRNIKIPRVKLDVYKKRLLAVVLAVAVLLIIGMITVMHVFTVDSVTIEGNTHYTNEEIYEMVMGDRLGRNSLYLSMKYKNKDIEGIPFIQSMSVNILSPSSIKITVYEKAMAGFVEYMGRYFYFDKDGTVVESSDVKTKGIPQILGLNFDHIVLYEKLPVESDEIFRNILEMTQLLSKYDIEMDKIYFDDNFNMTLYFGNARIKIGNFDYIDEKIIRLKDILPELNDKKGVLRLDNYNGSDSIITFEVDD